MKRLLRVSAAIGAVASVLVASSPARAQMHVGSSDWRRLDRSESLGKSASTQQFTFEMRFGQYFPEVDDKPGLAKDANGYLPYKSVFQTPDTSTSPPTPRSNAQFYFGMELDYLPFRIPYLGALGPGLGWGFTHASAIAKFSSERDSSKPSASTTSTGFTIMPMHLSAVLRFDELMRRTGVPIVPYGKIGLGMGIWMASPVPTGYTGIGATWGMHYAFGGMLALNFLDPRSAARLDESTGVNHAYLFGEFMRANLNGLGSTPTFYLGSTSWVVGLAIDL